MSRQELMMEAIRRLEAGGHCFTFIEGGALQHYGWVQVSSGPIHLADLGFSHAVPPQTAFVYDLYTGPHLRGRGVEERSVQGQLRFARALGAEHLITAVAEKDTALRQALGAGGARHVLTVTRRSFLGWAWTRSIGTASVPS